MTSPEAEMEATIRRAEEPLYEAGVLETVRDVAETALDLKDRWEDLPEETREYLKLRVPQMVREVWPMLRDRRFAQLVASAISLVVPADLRVISRSRWDAYLRSTVLRAAARVGVGQDSWAGPQVRQYSRRCQARLGRAPGTDSRFGRGWLRESESERMAASGRSRSTMRRAGPRMVAAGAPRPSVRSPRVMTPARAAATRRRGGRGMAARSVFNNLRDGYARRLGVGPNGQVHHAIELQALDRYPGVFTPTELNAFGNMRGIPMENEGRRQLHNSKVREIWDRHYRQLDGEIARRGLVPGTPGYQTYVRDWMTAAKDELDYVLGQFFSEYRTGRPRSFP